MPRRVTSCDEVREDLGRLAVGGALCDHALDVARHVRRCAACDEFVDELAAMRQFVEQLEAPVARRYDLAALRWRATVALERELAARLARDLVALARGEPCRSPDDRAVDVARLTALRGVALWSDEPWWSAREVLEGRQPIEPDHALGLAARLDPLGMDVALGWLGLLERNGRPAIAGRVAAQLLFEVG